MVVGNITNALVVSSKLLAKTLVFIYPDHLVKFLSINFFFKQTHGVKAVASLCFWRAPSVATGFFI